MRVQRQILTDGDERRVIITLIDHSAEVEYNKARTEKLVMSMVNATVSHDIRNPLNSISCQNAVMKMLIERIGDVMQKETLPPEFKATLLRIQTKMLASYDLNVSGERLISFLVDDFLDLGQLRADQFRKTERTFQIKEPIEEIIDILRVKAAHKHIEVSTRYIDLESSTLVRCDARRVTQVLLNLLSNALKFTPANGQIQIKVRFIKPQCSDGI